MKSIPFWSEEGPVVERTGFLSFTWAKEAEDELAEKYRDSSITPTVRFSDLYKRKVNSVYTTLPEYVYKQWYSGRSITIGDASHKVHITRFCSHNSS